MVRAIAVPTRLDALRRRYVHGELELDAFELAVAELLASGREHDAAPLMRPPSSAGECVTARSS